MFCSLKLLLLLWRYYLIVLVSSHIKKVVTMYKGAWDSSSEAGPMKAADN